MTWKRLRIALSTFPNFGAEFEETTSLCVGENCSKSLYILLAEIVSVEVNCLIRASSHCFPVPVSGVIASRSPFSAIISAGCRSLLLTINVVGGIAPAYWPNACSRVCREKFLCQIHHRHIRRKQPLLSRFPLSSNQPRAANMKPILHLHMRILLPLDASVGSLSSGEGATELNFVT